MKTLYVTIPNIELERLIKKYSTACPITEEDDFAVYLSLEELKRRRDDIALSEDEDKKDG